MATIPRPLVTLLLALSTLWLSPAGIAAQGGRPMVPDLKSSTTLGLGYVVCAPNELVGIAVMGLTPKLLGGAGVYADVKLTHTTPGNDPYFQDDLTAAQVEAMYDDHSFEGKSVWVSANFALVYAATRELGVYLGGGYSRERHYREYWDDTATRGFEGFYWVLDPSRSGNRLNALGGMLMRAGPHLVIQLGGETQPLGGTVGLMLTLPF